MLACLFFWFTKYSLPPLPIGVLLPELVVSIVLLLSKNAGLIQEAGAIPLLAGLLEHLDRFNHLAPGKDRDDNEDLAWPGIMGMLFIGNIAGIFLLGDSCL